MFFKAAQKGRNFFLYYIATFILCLIGYAFIGSLPFRFFIINNLDKQTIIKTQFELTQKNLPLVQTQIINSFHDKNGALLFILLIFVATFLFLLLGLKIQKKTLTSISTGAKKFRWKQFLFAFGVGALTVILGTVVSYFSSPEEFILQFEPTLFLKLVAICLTLLTLQACTEELLFRGWLTQGIGLLFKSRLAALLIPSILFGAMHLANPEVAEHGILKMFPLYIIMGLTFGIITLMNDGAELAMGYHSANNIFIALLVTSPEAVLQTNSIFRMTKPQEIENQILPVLIGNIIIIGIFAWKYKWKNWKEKLIDPIEINQQNEF